MKPLTIPLLAVACYFSNASEHTIIDRELGCEISLPESWTVAKDVNKKSSATSPLSGVKGKVVTSGCATEPQDYKLRLNVSVDTYELPKGKVLKDFVDNESGAINGEKTQMRIASKNGWKLVLYKPLPNTDAKNQWNYYYVATDTRVYRIRVAGHASGWEKYNKDVEDMVKSFKIL